MKWGWFPDAFPPSRPLEAKGGIKARSKRGFGEKWWSKRWIEVLESFELGGRLQRGRSYARRGQVLSIDIASGSVDAKVQGSRSAPYRITITIATLTPAQWKAVAAELASRPLLAARLLAGEMPEDIGALFESAGSSLFPNRSKDLVTECSCPDWSNPCKHIAAVYYLLGEEFDRDPFLIFRLRGGSRDTVVAGLEETPGRRPTAPARERKSEDWPRLVPVGAFWGESLPDALLRPLDAPSKPAPLLRRLGGFPFWRGRQSVEEALTPIYTAASSAALGVLGEVRS
jgi:uncharacterized Zn finger protein